MAALAKWMVLRWTPTDEDVVTGLVEVIVMAVVVVVVDVSSAKEAMVDQNLVVDPDQAPLSERAPTLTIACERIKEEAMVLGGVAKLA